MPPPFEALTAKKDRVAALSASNSTKNVVVVSEYDDVHVAARLMRSRRIHRVVVTREKKVVGILSAFDLMKLVEERRFRAKNPPTPKKRKPSRRK